MAAAEPGMRDLVNVDLDPPERIEA